MVSGTSIEAYHGGIDSGKIGRRAREVYEILLLNGPMSGNEIGRWASWHNCPASGRNIHARLNALVKSGHVVILNDDYECSVTHNRVYLFQAVLEHLRKPLIETRTKCPQCKGRGYISKTHVQTKPDAEQLAFPYMEGELTHG